jgi:hypothetical protein
MHFCSIHVRHCWHQDRHFDHRWLH